MCQLAGFWLPLGESGVDFIEGPRCIRITCHQNLYWRYGLGSAFRQGVPHPAVELLGTKFCPAVEADGTVWPDVSKGLVRQGRRSKFLPLILSGRLDCVTPFVLMTSRLHGPITEIGTGGNTERSRTWRHGVCVLRWVCISDPPIAD